MRIIKPSTLLFLDNEPNHLLKKVETAARTCYKSESCSDEERLKNFIANLIHSKHESVLEHVSITVKFVCDRGVSHELVRHRIAAFSQESTRYCNYGRERCITFIAPCFLENVPLGEFDAVPANIYISLPKLSAEWMMCMLQCETAYLEMLDHGATPQEARSVLPNSLKTELVVTANLREWRHIFKLRAAGEQGKPHPQMLELMVPLLDKFKSYVPVFFDDIKGLK